MRPRRAAELGDTGFVQFDFDRACYRGTGTPPTAPREQRGSLLRTTTYAGSVSPDVERAASDQPMQVCGMIMPMDVGRLLVDIVPQVRLPSPNFVGRALDVGCTSDSVIFSADNRRVAAWQYWYADWQPTTPRDLDSLLGYRTVMDREVLLQACNAKGLTHGVWCEVTWGTREYSYSEFATQTSSFWISEPAS